MKQLLTLIVSIFLVLNTSVLMAGAHKDKPADSDDLATMLGDDSDDDGDRRRRNERQERQAAESDSDDRKTDSDSDDSDSDDSDDRKDKANRGSERSREMRDRRDERKAIREDYKSTREPGQEGGKDGNGKTEKKPWYRFWD